MQHVAIDLGGRESQICIRQPDGTIIEERRYATRLLPKWVSQLAPSRVILETSAEAFRIADAARAAGHEVRVVPATLVRTLGVGDRGVKTDRKDAQALSRVSCQVDLPSVHVPSELSRQLKSMCGNREQLITCRTKLINNVRGWLRTHLWRVQRGATTSFPARVRAHAKTIEQVLADHVERTLSLIEELTNQLRIADRELEKISTEHPIARKLVTVPGVGPVTAVRFLAAIDDVTRFPNAHMVQSYIGLTPGENSSSDTRHRTRITKAGPSRLRRTLVQGAWCLMRSRSMDPLAVWARTLAARKHKFIAVVALARRLSGIMFAIWRDGTTYSARPLAPPQEARAS